jgi:hypothetical protein
MDGVQTAPDPKKPDKAFVSSKHNMFICQAFLLRDSFLFSLSGPLLPIA